jgi:hypothetical protein
MLFHEEIGEGARRCNVCGRTIKAGEVMWRIYGHRSCENYCMLCIGKSIKKYTDEFDAILDKIEVKG